MEEQISVSVIVPIWNAGKRIIRCLDTLSNQTLKNIEFICVLDCPTDGTDKIVEEYAANDSRFVILRNEQNLHVAGSRNRGLSVARGEYIGFCDHDDICDPVMFDSLYKEACETGADVVLSDAIFKEDRKQTIERFPMCNQHDMVWSIILPMEVPDQVQQASHCIWHSIYRREFLKNNNITFPSRKEYLDEDRLFNLQVYLNTDKIKYVDRPYYTWIRYNESTSNQVDPMMVPLQIHRLDYMIKMLESANCLEEYRNALYRLVNFDLQVFLPIYESLSSQYLQLLAGSLKKINYLRINVPVGYNLRLISRKRLRIFFFRFRLQMIRHAV